MSAAQVGHLCEHFLGHALEQARLRRPGRSYGQSVTRSDSNDAYELRIWAHWGVAPDVRTRRLLFEVGLRGMQEGTTEEAARVAVQHITAQVLELEAACDDIERGGSIRARPQIPWYGPVTADSQTLVQHAAEASALVDAHLAEFGRIFQQQMFPGKLASPTLSKGVDHAPKSLWQLLDELEQV
jgi:hypothetical protein